MQRLVAKEREVGALKNELEKLKSGASTEELQRERQREKDKAQPERERERNKSLLEECNRLRDHVRLFSCFTKVTDISIHFLQISELGKENDWKDKEVVYLKRALESVQSRGTDGKRYNDNDSTIQDKEKEFKKMLL